MFRTRTVATIAAALALTAACAPGSSGSSAPQTKSPSQISTDPAKAGKVTLRVWDQEVRGGQNAQMTALNKQFEAAYPNVTIKRTSKSFTDLKTTLKLALSGNTPPDVVEVNQGYPDMVSFVKAGFLRPLDGYSTVYQWPQRYSASLLSLNKVSKDKTHFGKGNLYGLSQMGEFVGIYANQAKLTKLGVSAPTTWADFLGDLAKAKAAGELPIQFGNLDKYPAIHTFGVIQDQLAGKADVRDLVLGTGQQSWTSDKTVQAASILQNWATQGYFPAGANGIGYDDAAKSFAGGQGVFLITGTWEAADLKKTMGDSLSMSLPPSADGGAPVTTGGQSLALSVTSKSKIPDVAAAYINFLTNAKASKVIQDTGNLPAQLGVAAPSGTGVDVDIAQGWQRLNQADGLVPYLDYSTPTFYDTITSSLQKLIGGKTTPQAFAQALQDDYAAFKGQ